MFEIYFTNFGYTAPLSYAVFEDAVAAARVACFECAIRKDGVAVASWSPIGGLNTACPASDPN